MPHTAFKHSASRTKAMTPKRAKSKDLECLPQLKFINLTGGEPFIREDLEEFVRICFTKSPRIVISTSGWFEDRVIALAEKFPNIGIRISMEGLANGDDEKSQLYKNVQSLAEKFKADNGSIICRDLLGLRINGKDDPTPQKRTAQYYKSRPCSELCRYAADLIDEFLKGNI